MKKEQITLFVKHIDNIDQINRIDPDRDWKYFSTGINIWIIQTYLRLKQAGLSVQFSSNVPKSGIALLHADDMHELLSGLKFFPNLLIVCVRADRSEQLYADIEIVQNGSSLSDKRCKFIPHWPQPGLIRRDPNRGDRIRTVVYKGETTELNDIFKSDAWVGFLKDKNIDWVTDSLKWDGIKKLNEKYSWNDYSQSDIVLAVRSNVENIYLNKPASKLFNAWAAGVPALLGPEFAYRELRKSELDFIEVSSLVEAQDAVLKLKANPIMYQDIINNGFERAKDFTVEEISKKWEKLLFGYLSKGFRGYANKVAMKVPVGFKKLLRD